VNEFALIFLAAIASEPSLVRPLSMFVLLQANAKRLQSKVSSCPPLNGGAGHGCKDLRLAGSSALHMPALIGLPAWMHIARWNL